MKDRAQKRALGSAAQGKQRDLMVFTRVLTCLGKNVFAEF